MAIMENSLEAPQKLKIKLPHDPAIPPLEYLFEQKENTNQKTKNTQKNNYIHHPLETNSPNSLSQPGGVSSKEPVCKCRRHKEMWVRSLGQEDPLKEGRVTCFNIPAWNIPQTESLVC